MFPMALGYAFAKTPTEVRQQVQRIADMSVAHVADVAPEVVVGITLREAEAGPALVEASTGSDLLVLLSLCGGTVPFASCCWGPWACTVRDMPGAVS